MLGGWIWHNILEKQTSLLKAVNVGCSQTQNQFSCVVSVKPSLTLSSPVSYSSSKRIQRSCESCSFAAKGGPPWTKERCQKCLADLGGGGDESCQGPSPCMKMFLYGPLLRNHTCNPAKPDLSSPRSHSKETIFKNQHPWKIICLLSIFLKWWIRGWHSHSHIQNFQNYPSDISHPPPCFTLTSKI